MSAVVAAPPRTRLVAVDRIRGLAIACMIFDHAVVVLHGPQPLRWTLGRLAMPLFFLLGGYLVRRLSWRHGWVFLLGLVLPVIVPWIDSPNVLVWFALGAVLCRLADTRAERWAALVLLLVVAANFPDQRDGTSYAPPMLPALMLVGGILRDYHGRAVVGCGDRLPRWLAPLGRYPLSVYAGHLILFELARRGLWV